MAGGVAPDVAQLSIIWARDLYDQGMLLELNSYLEKSPQTAPRNFIPATQVYNQKQGRIYGVTFVMDSAALAYNKDHFAAAGLDESPFALATWNDFLEAAKKLTRRSGDQVQRGGFGFWPSMELFTSWLYSNGGSFYNRDFTASAFHSEAGVRALQFLADLRTQYNVWGSGSFESEQVSMVHAGTWSGSFFHAQNPDLRFGLTSFPQGPDGWHHHVGQHVLDLSCQ